MLRASALAVRLIVLSALCAASVSVASAQTVVTGHYQPLYASGLKSGILPPAHTVIYQNSSLLYRANTFRDDDGNEIGGVNELNIWANRNTVLWVTGRRLLGADYAVAIALPFANLAPNPIVIDGVRGNTGIGLTDVPIAPLILGWHEGRFHVQAGYTVFVPVGRFELGGSDNTGKGFWTHMLHAAGTWMSSADRPWHASLMTRYELHSNQEGRDVRPGDTLTLEFGFGKKVTERIDVGLVGHTWRQVTDTTGSDAVNPLRYRSSGVGFELQFPVGKRVAAKLRGGADFGARNVSEGPFVVAEFNIPLKSGPTR